MRAKKGLLDCAIHALGVNRFGRWLQFTRGCPAGRAHCAWGRAFARPFLLLRWGPPRWSEIDDPDQREEL